MVLFNVGKDNEPTASLWILEADDRTKMNEHTCKIIMEPAY